MMNTLACRFHSGSRINGVAEETVAWHFGAHDACDARPSVQPDADGYWYIRSMWNTETFHSID